MNIPIAIVILTKDEPEFLKATVQSIVKNTHYPYELFIVDNNSQLDEQCQLLQQYDDKQEAQVVFNPKNQWVLGFNQAIKIVQQRQDLSADYLVLTDGDIVVPPPSEQLCWLGYLKTQMDQHAVVGKLGLSLDIGPIKNNTLFGKTYQREAEYMQGPTIGDLIIAPVDTTLAIYRQDLFVLNDFKILPGHASLVKPYYYVCRTRQHQAEHLGWKNYEQPPLSQLTEKVMCFAKYAGYVDPIVLNRVGYKTKYFYKIFRYLFKAYWSIKVVLHWTLYILPRFPRGLNEIQAKRR